MHNNEPARRRRPVLWLVIIAAAVALIWGAMAVLRLAGGGKYDSLTSVSGTKLGLAKVEGPIADPDKVVKWLRELREDESVKGVILRINSPGGVVGPSQEIFEAVAKLAKAKPVVASMGAVAASGGYYVACPATKIVANPGTLTGSIGVKAQLVNAQPLMDKLGLAFASFTSGKLKDAGTPFRPMTDEEKAYFESMVMDLKKQFVRDVAKGRNMDPAKVEELADGRAFTGEQALAAGLVDQLGGFEEAVDELKKLCHLEGKYPLRTGPKKEKHWLLDLMSESLGPLDPQGLLDNTIAGARISYE